VNYKKYKGMGTVGFMTLSLAVSPFQVQAGLMDFLTGKPTVKYSDLPGAEKSTSYTCARGTLPVKTGELCQGTPYLDPCTEEGTFVSPKNPNLCLKCKAGYAHSLAEKKCVPK
jgi:hypothetical protein